MTPAKKLEPTIETVSHKHRNVELPKQFDARTHWDKCSTISKILGGLGIDIELYAHPHILRFCNVGCFVTHLMFFENFIALVC